MTARRFTAADRRDSKSQSGRSRGLGNGVEPAMMCLSGPRSALTSSRLEDGQNRQPAHEADSIHCSLIMLDTLEQHARRAAGRLPATAHHWSVRGVREYSEQLCVRQDVAEAPQRAHENGAMVTVIDGGLGYAATSDLSEPGLGAAFERAHALARASAGRT